MELLMYLLKVSACTILFFAFYLLVLRKLTFFRINRFYLLLTLVISFVIPALQFSIEKEAELKVSPAIPTSEPPVYAIGQAQAVEGIQVLPANQEMDWISVITCAYLSIAAILLVISIYRLCRLLIHAGNHFKREKGLKLVYKSVGFTNCSFFNYVFIDEDGLSEKELAVLLRHEEVHTKQLHSIDKILLMVCKAILWFNPIVYLFDKALEQTHEYEADEATSLYSGTGTYAKLLLKLAVSKSDVALTHNFVKSPIKERIKMLFNLKSNNMKKLSYVLALPLAIGLVWLFSVQVVYASSAVNTKRAIRKISKQNKQNLKKQNTEPLIIADKKEKQVEHFTDTAGAGKDLIPRFISSSKITGNIRSNITSFEDVILKISGSTIKAKSAEWNKNNHELSVFDAVIKNGGTVIIAEKAVFNLLDGTYRTYELTSQNEKDVSFTDFGLKENENMISKMIQYKAKDSIKLSKDKNIIYLYGKAKLLTNDISIDAEEITYNSKTKMGSARDLVVTQLGSGTKIKGSKANFNLNGKVEIWQNINENLVVEP